MQTAMLKFRIERVIASLRFAQSVKLWLLFKRIFSFPIWKSTSLRSGTRKTASLRTLCPTSTKKAVSLCVCECNLSP